MLKSTLFLCLASAIMAYPGLRTQQEIEEYKIFLYNTKQSRDMTLEEAMIQNPKASAWENSGKYQGDIVLTDQQIEELTADYSRNVSDVPIMRNGLVPHRHRWPGQTIIYDIAPNSFSYAQKQMIYQALNFFYRNTCVRWVRRTNQRDFVWITVQQDGCYAIVGYWENFGPHVLNLARGCFNLQIIIHEMLHSAGFHHMHQVYSRYDFIWINWQNVQRGMEHNFNIFSNQAVNMLGIPYEYASNMHYGPWAFSINDQPTIGARFDTGGLMGQLAFVTAWDVLIIYRLYNCPGAWTMTVQADDNNKPIDEDFRNRMNHAAAREVGDGTANTG